MATLFAWTGALRKRANLTGTMNSSALPMTETAAIRTIEEGVMTRDLAGLSVLENKTVVNTSGFLREVRKRLDSILSKGSRSWFCAAVGRCDSSRDA